MNIRKAESPADLDILFPIIQELRPHLTPASYHELVQEAAKRDQYTLVGVFDGQVGLAAMGYRVLFDFVHGQHLYIDDLVVTESHRSKKLGSQLLAYAEAAARDLGCASLRLCTGTENAAGMRFYDREGWTLRAVAYKKPIAT